MERIFLGALQVDDCGDGISVWCGRVFMIRRDHRRIHDEGMSKVFHCFYPIDTQILAVTRYYFGKSSGEVHCVRLKSDLIQQETNKASGGSIPSNRRINKVVLS
jgi:hypothetical protein